MNHDSIIAALARWQPLPHEAREAPPLPDISLPWLRDHVAKLVSMRNIADQAGAAGAVLRLHMPAPALRAAILAGRATDASVAISTWARSLDRRERDAIERLAIERAIRLQNDVEQLDGDADLDEAMRLAHGREVLAGIQEVLWLVGWGKRLAGELRATDDVVVVNLSRFPPADAFENDELLVSVACSDPYAWWGRLALA